MLNATRGLRAALFATGSLIAATANAAPEGLAAGIKVGTTGFGVEGVTAITPMLNARALVNFFNYDYDTTEDGIAYEAELELQSYGALLDLHPFKGSFRITAGALGNGNAVSLKASCPGSCDLGDLTVQGGTAQINGDVDFKKFAPYLGIGFGNAMSGTGLYGIFDVGVMFQGEPQADLAAFGTAATVTDNNTGLSRSNVDLGSDPQVQQAVADEEVSLQSELEDFKFYPVVSLGIGYRFF